MTMNPKEEVCVLIGRFSPFHHGHGQLVFDGLRTAKKLIILVGSSKQARNIKNPFTFEERKELIYQWIEDHYPQREDDVVIIPLEDYPYNNQQWIEQVQMAVFTAKNMLHVKLNVKPILLGADRDKSTWYLRAFGDFFDTQIMSADAYKHTEISATKIRMPYLTSGEIVDKYIPTVTEEFLREFKKTEAYTGLVKEMEFVNKYKEAWKVAPYAPTFVTTDACVIQSGYILVNVRDNFPGKGLWALPGGFLEQDEQLIDGCVRELQEETRIELSPAQLYGSIKAQKTFDHPERSFRGRTITTCFLFKLADTKKLPKTKPQKGEVQKVMWIPIAEALANPQNWFEDHYHMVSWGVKTSY